MNWAYIVRVHNVKRIGIYTTTPYNYVAVDASFVHNKPIGIIGSTHNLCKQAHTQHIIHISDPTYPFKHAWHVRCRILLTNEILENRYRVHLNTVRRLFEVLGWSVRQRMSVFCESMCVCVCSTPLFVRLGDGIDHHLKLMCFIEVRCADEKTKTKLGW